MSKILLWCVFVLSCSALPQTRLPSLPRCSEIQKAVKLMKQLINDTTPDNLHAPVDIKTECLASALECFRYQISNLIVTKGQKNETLHYWINRVKSKRLHVEAKVTCLPCSEYAPKRPKEFIEDMLILLQQILNEYPKRT